MPYISTAAFAAFSPCLVSSFGSQKSSLSAFTRANIQRRAWASNKGSSTFRPLATAASNGSAITTSETSISSQKHSPSGFSALKQAPLIRFSALLFQHWRLLVPALVCALIASICAVVEPILFGRILNLLATLKTFTPAEGRRKLLVQVGVIALTYVIEIAGTAIFILLAARAADRVTRQLRESLFLATMANDVAFFDQEGRAEIERTASIQLRIARQAFWDNLSEDRGIRAILECVLGVILCLRLTGAIGIPAFCIFLPIITTLGARLGLLCGRLSARVEGKEADFLSFISERLRGLRTLKAFGAENKESMDLSVLLTNAQNTSTDFINARGKTECANRVNIYISILLFFVCGGHLVSVGAMSFETFSSLIGFIWVLNFCMHGILFTLTDASKASVALSKVFAVLDHARVYRATHVANHCEPAALPPSFTGDIRFQNVSFHYPSRPDASVLKDVSLEIYPGQVVALVGESGGGKSTIASLLCRFYLPTSGTVTLDGIDIQCIPSDVYARQLSMVDQEPFLFQGTIRDNIAYGLPDEVVSDTEIVRAAKEANAHGFIMELSKGYDTVWHPGSNLSGGQRQRIAIARSLLKSPRILVLDEATSALDQESERTVQQALERIMRNRTTLIIAHRLSTVRTADKILLVKGGQIIEQGTFNDLYSDKNGQFRALVDSSSAFALDSVERN